MKAVHGENIHESNDYHTDAKWNQLWIVKEKHLWKQNSRSFLMHEDYLFRSDNSKILLTHGIQLKG